MGRFGLVFSSIGAVLVGSVLVCVGRFRPSLGRFGDGPFWSVPVIILIFAPLTCQTNILQHNSHSAADAGFIMIENIEQ